MSSAGRWAIFGGVFLLIGAIVAFMALRHLRRKMEERLDAILDRIAQPESVIVISPRGKVWELSRECLDTFERGIARNNVHGLLGMGKDETVSTVELHLRDGSTMHLYRFRSGIYECEGVNFVLKDEHELYECVTDPDIIAEDRERQRETARGRKRRD
jgi:preprotein translocase subunit YajC